MSVLDGFLSGFENLGSQIGSVVNGSTSGATGSSGNPLPASSLGISGNLSNIENQFMGGGSSLGNILGTSGTSSSLFSSIPGLSTLSGLLGGGSSSSGGGLNIFGFGGSGSSGSNSLQTFSGGWGQIFGNIVLILIGFVILSHALNITPVTSTVVNVARGAALAE